MSEDIVLKNLKEQEAKKMVKAKRIIACLLSIILLATNIDISAFGEIVNNGTTVKIIANQTECLTGQTLDVNVKTSYSNPNEGEYSTVRLYLWDYNENFGSAGFTPTKNTAVQVLNMENGKITYTLNENKETSVDLVIHETETERYLEYTLPPGTSADMELTFTVPNGLHQSESVILEPVIVHPVKDNNSSSEPVTLTWDAEFLWDGLKKKVNKDLVRVTPENNIDSTLIYDFTANSHNTGNVGEVWTKKVTVTDSMVLPEGFVTDNLTAETADGKFTGNIKKGENTVFTLKSPNYEMVIENMSIQGNTISWTASLENPNQSEGILTSEFNPVKDISFTFYGDKIDLNNEYKPDRDEITNDVSMTFTPVEGEAITMEDEVKTLITTTESPLIVTKNGSSSFSILYNGNYSVNIANNSNYPQNVDFYDVLPDGLYFTDPETLSQNYTVKHADTIYQGTDTTIPVNREIENGILLVKFNELAENSTKATVKINYENGTSETLDKKITLSKSLQNKFGCKFPVNGDIASIEISGISNPTTSLYALSDYEKEQFGAILSHTEPIVIENGQNEYTFPETVSPEEYKYLRITLENAYPGNELTIGIGGKSYYYKLNEYTAHGITIRLNEIGNANTFTVNSTSNNRLNARYIIGEYNLSPTKPIPNYIETQLEIPANNSSSISYNVGAGTGNSASIKNTAFAGDDTLVYGEKQGTISPFKPVFTETTPRVSLNKEIVRNDFNGQSVKKGEDETALHTIYNGSRVYYTITLTNEEDEEKEITLIDYSPVMGSYNPETRSWIKSFSNPRSSGAFASFVNYANPAEGIYNDFQGHLSSDSYVTETDSKMKVTVPAHTTYKQTILIHYDDEDTLKYFKNALNNNSLTDIYASNYVSNTVFVEGTDTGASVRQDVGKSVSINKAIVGSQVINNMNISNNDRLLAINYNDQSLYHVPANTDVYTTYLLVFTNNSPEAINFNDTSVTDILPRGYEYYGMPVTTYDYPGGESKTGFIVNQGSFLFQGGNELSPIKDLIGDSLLQYLTIPRTVHSSGQNLTVQFNTGSSVLPPGKSAAILYTVKENSNCHPDQELDNTAYWSFPNERYVENSKNKLNKSDSTIGFSLQSSANTLSSTVEQEVPEDNIVNLATAKFVLGKNNINNVMAGNGLIYDSNTDYEKYTASGYEVETYMIALGSDSEHLNSTQDGFSVGFSDQLPQGTIFLGYHEHLNTNQKTLSPPNPLLAFVSSNIPPGGILLGQTGFGTNYTVPSTNGSYFSNLIYDQASNSIHGKVYMKKGNSAYLYYSVLVPKNIEAPNNKISNTFNVYQSDTSQPIINLWKDAAFYNMVPSFAVQVANGKPRYLNEGPIGYTIANPISATVTQTEIKLKSASIKKSVFAAYDKDDPNKNRTDPFVYYEKFNSGTDDSNTLEKSTDGKALASLTECPDILDNNAFVLPYSVIDGIHSTNWYRNSVIWKVTVNNNGLLPVDASKIIEQIDEPFKLYGYSVKLMDEEEHPVATYTKNYNGIKEPDSVASTHLSVRKNTSVTTNNYDIDIAEDYMNDNNLEVAEEGSFPYHLRNLQSGWTYELYLYTDMTQEDFDWYYDTTILKLDKMDEFYFQDDVIKEGDIGIKDSDWITMEAADGIKTIEKYDKRGNGYSSKEGYTYDTDEDTTTFTLEMGSYLYQTERFSDKRDSIDKITFYDLLPGTTQESATNGDGGGYSIDTNSYRAYILRSDGTREPISPEHYQVKYSLMSLHKGRHTVSPVDDTDYNVDFSLAAIEQIWKDDYTEDCRSFKVTFDDTVKLHEADRLYFDYNVTAREQRLDREYRNVFGYIYNINDYDNPNNNLRLFEDTSDVAYHKEPDDFRIEKVMVNNSMIEMNSEEFDNMEFTIGLYQVNGRTVNTGTLLKEFIIHPGDTIYLKNILDDMELTPGLYYQIRELGAEDYKANIEFTTKPSDYTSTYYYYNDYYEFFNFQYQKNMETSDFKLKIKNSLKNTGTLNISKRDASTNLSITKSETPIKFIIKDSHDEILHFDFTGTQWAYNPHGSYDYVAISLNSSTGKVTDLPYGTYTVEEIAPPSNYEISEGPKTVTINSASAQSIIFKDRWLNNPVNLTIVKKDSASGELLDNITFMIKNRTTTSTSTSYCVAFVDTGICDEKGHHYRLAGNATNKIYELATYHGKVYIENIQESSLSRMYIYEKQNNNPGYTANTSYSLATYIKNRYDLNPVITATNTPYFADKLVYKTDKDTGELIEDHVAYEIYKGLDEKQNLVYTGTELISYKDKWYLVPCYKIVDGDWRDPEFYPDAPVDKIESDCGIIKVKVPTRFNSNTNYYAQYSVKEVEAPENYVLEQTSKRFDSTNSITVPNTYQFGDAEITKKNTEGDIIADQTVAINVLNNDEKMTFRKIEDGVYEYDAEGAVTQLNFHEGKLNLKNMPTGTYKLDEIIVPSGYVTPETKPTITINGSHHYTPLSYNLVNNHNCGGVNFEKKDSKGNLIPAAAKFVITQEGREIRFTKDGEEYKYDESGRSEVSTQDGLLKLRNLPLGEYLLTETEAPDGFLTCSAVPFTIVSQNYSSPATRIVTDLHSVGHARVSKKNINGELIDDIAIFQIYNSENQIVRFTKTDNEGTIEYHYNTAGSTNRVNTTEGQILLKNLPLGIYTIKEISAPYGYALPLTDAQFEIKDPHYFKPCEVTVTDPSYQFGSEKYVSSSYEKIEEKDNPDNHGYGYYGSPEDYAAGNKNYIYVDGREDTVRYTLNVGNMSQKAFHNLVLIDKMSVVGDVGVINMDEDRDSEFAIKLKDGLFDVYLCHDGQRELIHDYTVQFTDNVAYTTEDWQGEGIGWYNTLKDSTRSFRIVFNNDFVLPSTYKIEVEFDGEIQSDADPGEIAWNSFGYRYSVGEIVLAPEPPKVGVKIPEEPVITKSAVGGTGNEEFTFDVYQGADIVYTTKIKNGENFTLSPKRIVNGQERGYLEAGKTYMVKERTTEGWQLVNVTGENGTVSTDGTEKVYEFTYDYGIKNTATFSNKGPTKGSIKVIKTNESKTPLKGVTFKLSNSADVEITKRTDENGEILFDELPNGSYKLTEIHTVEGYNLLSNSIDVQIPFEMTAEEANADNVDVSHAIYDSANGKYLFYDLTYEFTNGAELKLPITGHTPDSIPVIPLLLGMVCFVIGFYVNRKKKEKQRKTF